MRSRWREGPLDDVRSYRPGQDAPTQHTPRRKAYTLTAAEQRKVNARINRLLREADRAEGELVDQLHRELSALQVDVRALIAAEAGSPYTQLLAELDRRIGVRVEAMATKAAAGVAHAAMLGQQLVDQALAVAGAAGTSEGATAETVAAGRTAGTYARRLVHTVADLLHAGGSHQLLLLDGGRARPADVLVSIGTTLEGSPVFGRPAARLEAIARTEAGNAWGQAAQQHMTARAGDAQLAKRWIGSHHKTSRPHHARLEALHAPGGPVGPIPVGQRYTVGRYTTLHPRGPGLPGVEKLNCGCRSVPVVLSLPATAAG